MRGIFTREERAVVLFLTVSLLVGSAVVRAGRVFPSAIPDFSGAADSGREPADPEPSWPVDVNTAGAAELVRLPGIGPVRASAIVRHREERGGYAALDDLLEVKGIGPVTLDGLRSKATVGPFESAAADSSRVMDAPGPRGRGHETGGPP
jgi:competence ComEA-like helix-hairpin-helix protein